MLKEKYSNSPITENLFALISFIHLYSSILYMFSKVLSVHSMYDKIISIICIVYCDESLLQSIKKNHKSEEKKS